MAPLRKHALLIAIDSYRFLPERWQLAGCVNDIRALAEILCGRFAFARQDVHLLENEAATQEAIRRALRALRERVGPEEAVVLAFSGHGSRVRHPEGDEPDGWQETIVPADSGRGEHPSRDIRDEEIHAWLLGLSEVTTRVTLVFDSCFSGGIVRDPGSARVRGIPPGEHPAGERRRSSLRSAGKGPSGWLPWSDRYVLLAACRHDEHAYEIVLGEGDGEVHHGALSYFLQRELTAAGSDASHRDVFERAALQVTAMFQRQHPQLEGARDRELFGERVFAPFRFLPVREREGARIVLAGGAAHGLAVGSRWDILPQGSRDADPGVQRLAWVEVRRVDAVRAEAVILEGSEGGEAAGSRSVQPGDRAVESSPAPRDGYHTALGLANRDPASRIAGKIDLRLLRRAGGEWLPAEPDVREGGAVYHEGDLLAFEVVNRAEVPVYVSVLDFGLSGRVALLYPARGSHKPLAAGRSLRYGARPGEEIDLLLPAGFPSAGIETVKAFATTEAADFTALEQDGFRAMSADGRRAPGPLGELLGVVLPGQREAGEESDWATAARSFLLRRRRGVP